MRAAEAMIAATEQADPPRHLVLGKFGQEAVVKRLRASLDEVEAGRAVALAADFPDG